MTRTPSPRRSLLTTCLLWAVLLVTAVPASAGRYNARGPLADAEGATGGLGQAVALSEDGSLAVVGEPGYGGAAGTAVVYGHSAGGWKLVTRLTPNGEIGAGHFGAAVSIDSTAHTVLVGAPADNGGVGAAWAFALAGGIWSEQGRLTGGAGEVGAGHFGAAVALASGGALALVGAPLSQAGEGQAFTFHFYEGEGWSLYQHMDRAGVSGAAHFGASVALSNNGSAALVGAPAEGEGGAVFAYSYFGLESPYWIDGATISSPLSGAGFGSSAVIAFAGSMAVIGAPLAAEGRGAAYEYTRAGVQQAAFADPAAAPGSEFGSSVAFAGFTMDQVLVGAPGDGSGAGAAYDFDATGAGNWFAEPWTLKALAEPVAGDAYGTAVGVSADGSTALVGAPGASGGKGRAIPFDTGAPTGPETPQTGGENGGSPGGSAGGSTPFGTRPVQFQSPPPLGAGGVAPRPPARIRLTRRAQGSLSISWEASPSAGAVVGYRVYMLRRGTWKLIGTTTAGRRSFMRAGLPARGRARFAVRAVDSAGRLSAPRLSVWLGRG